MVTSSQRSVPSTVRSHIKVMRLQFNLHCGIIILWHPSASWQLFNREKIQKMRPLSFQMTSYSALHLLESLASPKFEIKKMNRCWNKEVKKKKRNIHYWDIKKEETKKTHLL